MALDTRDIESSLARRPRLEIANSKCHTSCEDCNLQQIPHDNPLISKTCTLRIVNLYVSKIGVMYFTPWALLRRMSALEREISLTAATEVAKRRHCTKEGNSLDSRAIESQRERYIIESTQTKEKKTSSLSHLVDSER